MFTIRKYTFDKKKKWDDFVMQAKNYHFMFFRDYIGYHQDRFEDYSLMFYINSKLIALLPAHIEDSKLISHRGLSFAGLVTSKDMKLYKMMELFQCLINYLKDNDFKGIVYKAIPHIYHIYPASEDLFALTFFGSQIIRRDSTSVVDLRDKINFEKARRSCIKKAKKEDLKIIYDDSLIPFFEMMESHLKQKYDSKPVHSINEIQDLKNKFPNQIKLFSAYKGEKLLAGILVYENLKVVKTQYISSNEKGRNLSAIDFLVDYLIHDIYKDFNYFDFGTSTDFNYGCGFNPSLMAQKEMFGARAVICDTYEMNFDIH